MKVTRFLDPDGRPRYGVEHGNGTATLLAGDPVEGWSTGAEVLPMGRTLCPVVPINIFGIGLNYRDHARETGAEIPRTPVVFMKPTSAVADPDAPIHIPACCTHGPEVDYEAELAVLIGRSARNVSEDAALDHVCGYTCANDVSARRWQKQGGAGQWIRGKGFDGFCPLGPVLVTAEEIENPQTLSVRSILNGQVMQDGRTSDMIFPVARLIHLLSQDLTLLAGTLILTGTPAGVGFTRRPPVFLSPGDEIVIEISRIGRLSNPVAAAAPIG